MTEHAEFSQRLRDVIHELRIQDKDLAEAGGVTKATMSAYIKGKTEPSQSIVANWVSRFNINANWLLIGEGPMFRQKAGEETSSTAAAHPAVTDAVAVRMETAARLLREAGAPDEEIRRAILALAGAGESFASGSDGGLAEG